MGTARLKPLIDDQAQTGETKKAKTDQQQEIENRGAP
jgi:hypothetical protein